MIQIFIWWLSGQFFYFSEAYDHFKHVWQCVSYLKYTYCILLDLKPVVQLNPQKSVPLSSHYNNRDLRLSQTIYYKTSIEYVVDIETLISEKKPTADCWMINLLLFWSLFFFCVSLAFCCIKETALYIQHQTWEEGRGYNKQR